MDLVFFFYGLSFVLMGVAVLVQPRAHSEYALARFIGLLGVFGLVLTVIAAGVWWASDPASAFPIWTRYALDWACTSISSATLPPVLPRANCVLCADISIC